MKDKQRIEFKKESFASYNIKQMDRLIISGPCEIEFTTIRVANSLDYEVKIAFSMPSATQVVKIKPETMGEMLEKQNREIWENRNKLN